MSASESVSGESVSKSVRESGSDEKKTVSGDDEEQYAPRELVTTASGLLKEEEKQSYTRMHARLCLKAGCTQNAVQLYFSSKKEYITGYGVVRPRYCKQCYSSHFRPCAECGYIFFAFEPITKSYHTHCPRHIQSEKRICKICEVCLPSLKFDRTRPRSFNAPLCSKCSQYISKCLHCGQKYVDTYIHAARNEKICEICEVRVAPCIKCRWRLVDISGLKLSNSNEEAVNKAWTVALCNECVQQNKTAAKSEAGNEPKKTMA